MKAQSVDKALIESIVAEVMAKLSPVAAASAAPSPSRKETTPLPTNAVVTNQSIESKVITADVLSEVVGKGATKIVVGRKAIVTPAAIDWLKSRKISWERGPARPTAASAPKTSSLIVLQTVTTGSQAVVDELRKEGFRCEIVGQDAEATELAVRALCTSETRGAIVLSEQSERIVCQANRNYKVRAAVLSSSRNWKQVREMLHPNLVCVPVLGKTFIELRRTVRDCIESVWEVPA